MPIFLHDRETFQRSYHLRSNLSPVSSKNPSQLITHTPFPAVSPEEQFAEKLHAYTLPREGRENTRVKDLVDLILLIERTKLDAARLVAARERLDSLLRRGPRT